MSEEIVFMLIEHNGVRIFKHVGSDRATGEIRAEDLPPRCEIRLLRRGKMIANAAVIQAHNVDKDTNNFVHGRAPLVAEDADAEAAVAASSVFLTDGMLLARAVLARNRGIRLGNKVCVIFDALIDNSASPPAEKSMFEWCQKLTCSRAAAAAKEERVRAVEEWIYHHLGEDSADRFFERHGKKSPEEQLKHARRLLAARERRTRNKRNR